MSGRKTILVTGVAGFWGSRVATRLATETDSRILGLDLEAPTPEVPGLDLIQADVRNPLLQSLLQVEGVDTVCHLPAVEAARPTSATSKFFVQGTVHLLEACAAAGVRRLVLKSSTAVYGAHPDNPAFLREDRTLRGSRRRGTVHDLIEIETFCTGFRHHVPDLALTILRFASIVGPEVDTAFTRFLANRWSPSILGFDPMIQVIHEDDVVAALVHAATHDVPGVFNVAALKPLPLARVRALAGKPALAIAHPLAAWSRRLARLVGLDAGRHAPLEIDYLRYPWVGDLARMEGELGFTPRYDAEEALRDMAVRRHGTPYPADPGWLARDEEQLRIEIDLRRQARQEADND
jgi:UDP-glucose 4-epimerase